MAMSTALIQHRQSLLRVGGGCGKQLTRLLGNCAHPSLPTQTLVSQTSATVMQPEPLNMLQQSHRRVSLQMQRRTREQARSMSTLQRRMLSTSPVVRSGAMQRADYTPPSFAAPRINMHFELAPDNTTVTTTMLLERKTSGNLELDGIDLQLQQICIRAEASESAEWKVLTDNEFVVSTEMLVVKGSSIPPSGRFELKTVVNVCPQTNKSLAGLYTDGGGAMMTQCEAHGFRRITYGLDRPDVLSVFSVSLVADKTQFPMLLSNGNQTKAEDLDNGQHTVSWCDPFPKPTYLFAVVAGNLGGIQSNFTTMSGKKVELNVYSEKKNVHQLDFAMDSLVRSMVWDEVKYGREYDLDIFNIVATDSFNMGAMENKGLNVFNTAYVLGHHSMSTDTDLEGILRVIGHEYFHNWTGNRITCRDWFQLTLKEGLTVFRDQQFTEDETGSTVKRIDDVSILRAAQWPEDASPMTHPIRPEAVEVQDNFYTATVYNKGAEVIRMYETLLGKKGFRRGMDIYFDRHDGQAVTCDDFRAAMADAAAEGDSENSDLLTSVIRGQFERWYDQDSTPSVDICTSWEPANNGSLTLKITQSCGASRSQPVKQPFVIPLRLGIMDANTGEDLVLNAMTDRETIPLLHGDVLLVTKGSQEISFTGIPENAIISPLRNFSAPVKLNVGSSTATELNFLMANDSDDFNRYNAAQQAATKQIRNIETNEAKGNVDKSFVDAMRVLLTDEKADPALRAAALTLPMYAELQGQLKVVNPDVLCESIKMVKQELADLLHDELMQQLRHCESMAKEEYSFDPESVGNRRLAGVCRDYLTSATNVDTEVVKLVKHTFDSASNMTDKISALKCLADMDCEESSDALLSFLDQWGDNSLVMDKWFAVQVRSNLPGAVQRARDLMEHRYYVNNNPNKLRAVVGSFARGNPKQFHALDGSGYRFLGEIIRALDPVNPQMASGFTKVFLDWKNYDLERQSLIRTELVSILNNEGVSNNTVEVVNAALAADSHSKM